nr:MAG TPA: hypothetical protein [Caudoviricetes sp.]
MLQNSSFIITHLLKFKNVTTHLYSVILGNFFSLLN